MVGESLLAPGVFVAAVADLEAGDDQVVETVAAASAWSLPAELCPLVAMRRADGVEEAVGLQSSDERQFRLVPRHAFDRELPSRLAAGGHHEQRPRSTGGAPRVWVRDGR